MTLVGMIIQRKNENPFLMTKETSLEILLALIS